MSLVHTSAEAAAAIQKCRGLPSFASEHFWVANVQPWPLPQSPYRHPSAAVQFTPYHEESSKTASVRGLSFALAVLKGDMSSVANMRLSQWLPWMKQDVVSWFSSSAPASEGHPKKACAASATRGVTMRATQSYACFPVLPKGMLEVAAVAPLHAHAMPRSVA